MLEKCLIVCLLLTLLSVVVDAKEDGLLLRKLRERSSKSDKGYKSRDDATSSSGRGMVIVASNYDFQTTLDNLVAALNGNPAIRIVAQIDHRANAASIGTELQPNTLVVFGNPNLGTPLMERNPFAGLDLPQKMLVFETDGDVYVGYNPTDYLVARYGRRLLQVDTLATIANALRNLAQTATGATNIDDSLSIGAIRTKLGRGWRRVRSKHSFEGTYRRLTDAIAASPANVAFTVDHAQNAPNNELQPLRLVVFGNPAVGTPLMQESPSTGIDLPLKILLRQDEDGAVWVAYNTVRFLSRRHGLNSVDLERVTTALSNFVRVAARGE